MDYTALINLGVTMKVKNLFISTALSSLLTFSVSAQSVQTSTTGSTDLWSKIAENTNLFLYVGFNHMGTTDTYTGYGQTNIAYLTYNLSPTTV